MTSKGVLRLFTKPSFLTAELNIFNHLVLYIMSGDLSKYAGGVLGKRPSWKLPSQVEAIHYHHNRLKIPNTNTQIPDSYMII
jgi:hypothetical protein